MASFTFDELSPASFLERADAVFADRLAVVDGSLRLTYRELASRCRGLTSALAQAAVGEGDRVAALCTNSHVMIELHSAVPSRGAVLVSLNIRLAASELIYVLKHSKAKILIATVELGDIAREVAESVGIPCIVDGESDDAYEAWIASVPARSEDVAAIDERQLIAINYTSGTTGRPRGVMLHHRGAYLQSLAMAYHAGLDTESQYLWTLPMFHCNGWCFTWAVTAAGGTHVCLRSIDTAEIWQLLRSESITHFNAAPTVLTMLAEDRSAGALERTVTISTGGSPPSPALLERLEPWGFDVTHLYGLTETFGPIAINVPDRQWEQLGRTERARMLARQGLSTIIGQPLRVVDDEGVDVPADGETIGDLVVRGNGVMVGYYRDVEATTFATRSGCFVTGDLAVMHPDGRIELRDRRKDLIISGGENISSVEIERVLDSHPDVIESAVVGAPDERWGEVAVAFVTCREGTPLTSDEVRSFARERLAGFKVPKKIYFEPLPKTSTGKIQKNLLRRQVVDHP
jgi:fatty-acyl-CoA synthase